jgi:suppressor of G2 allele of SKP1
LSHEVVSAESKYEVLSTKIEIKMKKAKIGLKWGMLEGEDDRAGLMTTVTGGKLTLSENSNI